MMANIPGLSYRTMPIHDSAQILAIKLASWKKEIAGVREYYSDEHDNMKSLDGERSKWWVWNRATEVAKESVQQIQVYLQRIADGKCTDTGLPTEDSRW